MPGATRHGYRTGKPDWSLSLWLPVTPFTKAVLPSLKAPIRWSTACFPVWKAPVRGHGTGPLHLSYDSPHAHGPGGRERRPTGIVEGILLGVAPGRDLVQVVYLGDDSRTYQRGWGSKIDRGRKPAQGVNQQVAPGDPWGHVGQPQSCLCRGTRAQRLLLRALL